MYEIISPIGIVSKTFRQIWLSQKATKSKSNTVIIDIKNHDDVMETFSALLDLCGGNSPITGEFPSQRPVTRSFYVFFDLRLNKQLSKPSRRW